MENKKIIIGYSKEVEVESNLIPNLYIDDKIKSNTLKLLGKKNIPLTEIQYDLLTLSEMVYITDQIVNRKKYGFDTWSRYFELILPVNNIDLWTNAKSVIEDMLSFLSGDKWIISPSERKKKIELKSKGGEDAKIDKPDYVSLFSGGLDSFIGVVDHLIQGQKIFTVGHHKQNEANYCIQDELYNEISKQYKDTLLGNFFPYVGIDRADNTYGSENTSRARSFLFLTLGIIIANYFGDKVNLLVPENGFISLNIPLTQARLGTFSTRTTHPYFIHMYNEFLKKIEVQNEVLNPYQFSTKGQMLSKVKDNEIIKKLAEQTISCAKPGYHVRYSKGNHQHCGHCAPCIIRRASFHKAKMSEKGYHVDCNSPGSEYFKGDSGRDIRAFKMAITRNKRYKPNLLYKILESGPIPDILENKDKYIEVYKNGMKEVEEIL